MNPVKPGAPKMSTGFLFKGAETKTVSAFSDTRIFRHLGPNYSKSNPLNAPYWWDRFLPRHRLSISRAPCTTSIPSLGASSPRCSGSFRATSGMTTIHLYAELGISQNCCHPTHEVIPTACRVFRQVDLSFELLKFRVKHNRKQKNQCTESRSSGARRSRELRRICKTLTSGPSADCSCTSKMIRYWVLRLP